MCIVGSILVWRWLLSDRAQEASAAPDDDEEEPKYENDSRGVSQGGIRPADFWPAIDI